jgi:hypothetical protein
MPLPGASASPSSFRRTTASAAFRRLRPGLVFRLGTRESNAPGKSPLGGWFPLALRFELSLSPVFEIGAIDPAPRLVDLICTAFDVGHVPRARHTRWRQFCLYCRKHFVYLVYLVSAIGTSHDSPHCCSVRAAPVMSIGRFDGGERPDLMPGSRPYRSNRGARCT